MDVFYLLPSVLFEYVCTVFLGFVCLTTNTCLLTLKKKTNTLLLLKNSKAAPIKLQKCLVGLNLLLDARI